MKEITFQNQISKSLLTAVNKPAHNNVSNTGFSDLLKSSIGEVNKLQKDAELASNELVAGNNKDIHQTMIALEKADVSFQLMMKVRNKIIEAYDEIKRMQV
jgi:flagellar hook-basal body complex protein FliE